MNGRWLLLLLFGVMLGCSPIRPNSLLDAIFVAPDLTGEALSARPVLIVPLSGVPNNLQAHLQRGDLRLGLDNVLRRTVVEKRPDIRFISVHDVPEHEAKIAAVQSEYDTHAKVPPERIVALAEATGAGHVMVMRLDTFEDQAGVKERNTTENGKSKTYYKDVRKVQITGRVVLFSADGRAVFEGLETGWWRLEGSERDNFSGGLFSGLTDPKGLNDSGNTARAVASYARVADYMLYNIVARWPR